MIKDKKKFCDDLKEFFKAQGLTQQNIAERLKVSQSYVGMLMSGAKAFGKNTAQTWADEFGLSAAWLLTGEGAMVCGVVQNNQNGDNYQGDGMTVHKDGEDLREQIKKKDEQIDRLLRIIEKMQGL